MPTKQADLQGLEELERAVRELAGADSPSAVFRRILQSCARHAPRAAVFLIRKGRVCGWSGSGHRTEAIEALRAFSAPLGRSWSDGSERPDFGQPAADEARLIPVEVKSSPIAFVLVERSTGQRPWSPEGLSLLATVARMRLEYDLLLRKSEAAKDSSESQPSAPPPAAVRRGEPEPVAPRAAAPEPVAPEAPAPAPESRPLEVLEDLAPDTTEIDAAPPADSPEMAAARRFARLIATDIRIYHEDAVLHGQREGDLTERLGEQLDLGKQTFLKRHGALGPAGIALLREAYVEVLAGGKAGLIPARLLD